MWRSFFAAIVAYIPARFLPKYFYDKETQFWQYEATWFVTFLVIYTFAIFLMRPRVKSLEKNL